MLVEMSMNWLNWFYDLLQPANLRQVSITPSHNNKSLNIVCFCKWLGWGQAMVGVELSFENSVYFFVKAHISEWYGYVYTIQYTLWGCWTKLEMSQLITFTHLLVFDPLYECSRQTAGVVPQLSPAGGTMQHSAPAGSADNVTCRTTGDGQVPGDD